VAVYFLNIKTFGRSGNSSAVSAAAYRSGERLHDERTGKTYDHSARQDVLHKEIVLPSHFSNGEAKWALDRATLWNTAEHAETRSNARVAREYLVALPAELDAGQQVSLTKTFARELTDRYGFAMDVAIHAPREYLGSDPRNFHAHLLATTREVEPQGLGSKTRMDWQYAKRTAAGLGPGINEIFEVRQRWAEVANEALHEAHLDVRIDHRTLRAQGIDREPYPYIPKAAFEMERHGYRSFQAERVREEYQARVAAHEREQRAALERPAGAAPGNPQAKSLEEIRREARENWLRMREGRSESAQSAAPQRSRDEDLSR
jgi:hypothetical protein